MTARIESRRRRIGLAVLSAVFLVAPAALLSLGGLLVWGMRCDEGCVDRAQTPGFGWQNYVDSWQWTGQFVVVIAGLVSALTTTVLAARGAKTASIWSACITVGLCTGWYAWVTGALS